MHAFVSYARADLPAAERLRDALRLMGCQVWMDLQAGGGREWWAAILQNIRDCDLFIAVLSPDGLESLACTRERDYASALGKSILPVQATTVSIRLLPAALARLNIVDFSESDTFQTGVRLTAAVLSAPAPPPLPDPLPAEPSVPLSYLAELGEVVRAESLTFNDQMAAAARLRDALTRPEDHEDALVLIRIFADREDLYLRVHAQIQDLFTTARQPARRREPFPTASAEVRRTLTGHTDTVWEVAFNADGSVLATTSEDKTVRLWDPATGRHLHTLIGHTDAVYAVAFSPDGSLVATASEDKTARLWDPTTGRQIRLLKGHTGGVNGVAFSPDGTLLATASDDRTARLWEPTTGQQVRSLNGHANTVHWSCFSPDGSVLVTASGDGSAQLWNPATGQHMRTLRVHTDSISVVSFRPDGTLVATASRDTTARLWDPATGQHVRTLIGHASMLFGLAFSPDGTVLATTSEDQTIRLWNPAAGQHIRTLEGSGASVQCVAFSPDGLLLASGGVDRIVRLWG